jgi:hypothetical protein
MVLFPSTFARASKNAGPVWSPTLPSFQLSSEDCLWGSDREGTGLIGPASKYHGYRLADSVDYIVAYVIH